MNNKISYMMFQAFVARGFSTLRFNFRGVGRSQGMFDGGEGEFQERCGVCAGLDTGNQQRTLLMFGCLVSPFGSLIGMQLLMRRPEIQGFISVAAPAHMDDFSFLAPCPTSGLFVHGRQDDVVPENNVSELVERLHQQKGINIDYRVIDGANHFFHGHADLLMEHIHDHLNKAEAGRTVATESIAA